MCNSINEMSNENSELIAWCRNCKDPKGPFSSLDELRKKIAQLGECNKCGQGFGFIEGSDEIFGLGWDEVSEEKEIGKERRRLFCTEIDDVGTFEDGRIKLDVILEDRKGKEFVWTPAWEDAEQISVIADRVETTNYVASEWKTKFKERDKLSRGTLRSFSRIVGNNMDHYEIEDLFKEAGFGVEYEGQTLWRMVFQKMEELNEKSLQDVLGVISKAGDPRLWGGKNEKYSRILSKLNEILEPERLELNENGVKILRE